MASPEFTFNADIVLQNNPSIVRQAAQLQQLFSKGFKVQGGFGGVFSEGTSKIHEFDKALNLANKRLVSFGATASVLTAITLGFRSMVAETINVEKKLKDINVLLGLSEKSLGGFRDTLFNIAKDTGSSFNLVAKAATEFSRQGLSVQETAKRTADAMKLVRLSGLETEAAVETLTATINGFNKEAYDSSQIVAKLAAVDAKFAVNSKDLAESLSRSSASAEDAGVSLDQLLAITTALQQKTARGGAVIGNALKSIFTRIGRTDTLDQLEDLGIKVRDLAGNTLPAIEILTSLANRVDGLTDTQRSFVTELVGGVYQINQLKAGLSDLSKTNGIYAQSLGIAANAQDEANERNKESNQTLAAQINAAKENFGQLSSIFGQDVFGPALKNILGLFNGIASKLESDEGVRNMGLSIAKGIGNALSGPGIVIAIAAVGKIVAGLAATLKAGVSDLVKVVGAGKENLNIEQGIVRLLQEDAKLRAIITSETVSQVAKERELLAAIQARVAAQERGAALVGSLSGAALNAGARYKGGSFKFGASGYIPNAALDDETKMTEVREAKKAGYNISPKDVMGMETSVGGKKTVIIYNAKEKVTKNYRGTGEPMIVPPNKKMYAAAGLETSLALIRAAKSRKEIRDIVKQLGLSGQVDVTGKSLEKIKGQAELALENKAIKSGIPSTGLPIRPTSNGVNISSVPPVTPPAYDPTSNNEVQGSLRSKEITRRTEELRKKREEQARIKSEAEERRRIEYDKVSRNREEAQERYNKREAQKAFQRNARNQRFSSAALGGSFAIPLIGGAIQQNVQDPVLGRQIGGISNAVGLGLSLGSFAGPKGAAIGGLAGLGYGVFNARREKLNGGDIIEQRRQQTEKADQVLAGVSAFADIAAKLEEAVNTGNVKELPNLFAGLNNTLSQIDDASLKNELIKNSRDQKSISGIIERLNNQGAKEKATTNFLAGAANFDPKNLGEAERSLKSLADSFVQSGLGLEAIPQQFKDKLNQSGYEDLFNNFKSASEEAKRAAEANKESANKIAEVNVQYRKTLSMLEAQANSTTVLNRAKESGNLDLLELRAKNSLSLDSAGTSQSAIALAEAEISRQRIIRDRNEELQSAGKDIQATIADILEKTPSLKFTEIGRLAEAAKTSGSAKDLAAQIDLANAPLKKYFEDQRIDGTDQINKLGEIATELGLISVKEESQTKLLQEQVKGQLALIRQQSLSRTVGGGDPSKIRGFDRFTITQGTVARSRILSENRTQRALGTDAQALSNAADPLTRGAIQNNINQRNLRNSQSIVASIVAQKEAGLFASPDDFKDGKLPESQRRLQATARKDLIEGSIREQVDSFLKIFRDQSEVLLGGSGLQSNAQNAVRAAGLSGNGRDIANAIAAVTRSPIGNSEERGRRSLLLDELDKLRTGLNPQNLRDRAEGYANSVLPFESISRATLDNIKNLKTGVDEQTKATQELLSVSQSVSLNTEETNAILLALKDLTATQAQVSSKQSEVNKGRAEFDLYNQEVSSITKSIASDKSAVAKFQTGNILDKLLVSSDSEKYIRNALNNQETIDFSKIKGKFGNSFKESDFNNIFDSKGESLVSYNRRIENLRSGPKRLEEITPLRDKAGKALVPQINDLAKLQGGKPVYYENGKFVEGNPIDPKKTTLGISSARFDQEQARRKFIGPVMPPGFVPGNTTIPTPRSIQNPYSFSPVDSVFAETALSNNRYWVDSQRNEGPANLDIVSDRLRQLNSYASNASTDGTITKEEQSNINELLSGLRELIAGAKSNVDNIVSREGTKNLDGTISISINGQAVTETEDKIGQAVQRIWDQQYAAEKMRVDQVIAWSKSQGNRVPPIATPKQ